VIRLPEESLREFMAAGGKPFEPRPGRPMKGYAVAPEEPLQDKACAGGLAGALLP
jgi:hypothetical protein